MVEEGGGNYALVSFRGRVRAWASLSPRQCRILAGKLNRIADELEREMRKNNDS